MTMIGLRVLGRSGHGIAKFCESLLTERSLLLFGLLLAAFIACRASWLQPSLSPGLSGTQIGLLREQNELTPENSFGFDSPASLVLGSAILSVMILIRSAHNPSYVGGMIASAALVGHICLLANHPLLVDKLAIESEQFEQISSVFRQATSGASIVASPPAATLRDVLAVTDRPQFGLSYLGPSVWLIPLGWALQLYAGCGSCGRRIGRLLAWAAAACLIASFLCRDRIVSEYRWHLAQEKLIAGDPAAARRSLAKSLERMPALGGLARTWRLAGKIDYLSGVLSPQREYFRARQLLGNRQYAMAAEALTHLCASTPNVPSIRSAAAEAWLLVGLSQAVTGESEGAHRDDRRPGPGAGVLTAWQRVLELDPHHMPGRVCVVLAEAQSSSNADLVADLSTDLLNQLSNAALRADLLATLGDVFFESGKYDDARRFYRASRTAYELPKSINFRARTGLAGI